VFRGRALGSGLVGRGLSLGFGLGGVGIIIFAFTMLSLFFPAISVHQGCVFFDRYGDAHFLFNLISPTRGAAPRVLLNVSI